MDDDSKKKSAVEEAAEFLGAVMEHANQEDHIKECPFYRDKSKASSGAVSNDYRKGWDAVFGGRVPLGQA